MTNSPRPSAAPAWVGGIVVALPEELATLSRQKPAQGECLALADNILLAHAGAGPANAERATRQLIEQGATRLLSWGCAAALAPQLRPGDLLLPERLIAEDRQNVLIDRRWLQHAKGLLDNKLTASLAESSRIIATGRDKQIYYQQTAALALDMESVAVAKTARQQDLPCLVIRAIADPVAMDLPDAVVHSLNPQGQVELSRLLRYLAIHPWEIPALIELGLHFHAAQKALRTTAAKLADIFDFQP